MNIVKVVETEEAFIWYFEDMEEATEFRDEMRDAGYYVPSLDKDQQYWTIRVQKYTVMYVFWRETIQLRSPGKLVDMTESEDSWKKIFEKVAPWSGEDVVERQDSES